MNIDRIIFEDEHLLIYNKPAGMAVQTKKVTEVDLESMIKGYLYEKCGANKEKEEEEDNEIIGLKPKNAKEGKKAKKKKKQFEDVDFELGFKIK